MALGIVAEMLAPYAPASDQLRTLGARVHAAFDKA